MHNKVFRLATVVLLLPLTDAPAYAVDGAEIAAKGTTAGATACITCHGAKGEGIAAAGFPRLAGLNGDYLVSQLDAFRAGGRTNPVMVPVAKALTAEESKAVAAYYSGLDVPAALPVAPTDKDSASFPLAKALAKYGDWVGRHLPACEQCHGPGGRGAGPAFPALTGQGAAYITAQIQAFAKGARQGDSLGLMKSVAGKLSADEVSAIAAWYAAYPPAGQAPDALKSIVAADFAAPAAVAGSDAVFRSPPRSDYPQGEFGDAVRRGEAMFMDTNRQPGSSDYVGNDQQCANCHLGEGRLAGSAPMWASWVSYPAYRSKNKKVNTFIERIQGCFTYSMNAQASKKGHAPAADSPVLVDLNSYVFWLSKGAPTGDNKMSGRGYPKLAEPDGGFEPQRGARVFAERCALCHGDDGQGLMAGEALVFPPLWGARAYNWGAGMHSIDKAAAFIKANMPLGLPNTLSDQQAWDVAAYINSFDRPQDPRFSGDLAETTRKFHAGKFDYYGKRKGPDGAILGSASVRGRAE